MSYQELSLQQKKKLERVHTRPLHPNEVGNTNKTVIHKGIYTYKLTELPRESDGATRAKIFRAEEVKTTPNGIPEVLAAKRVILSPLQVLTEIPELVGVLIDS